MLMRCSVCVVEARACRMWRAELVIRVCEWQAFFFLSTQAAACACQSRVKTSQLPNGPGERDAQWSRHTEHTHPHHSRPTCFGRDCGQDSCAPDCDSLHTWLTAGKGELACVATLKPNLFDACSGVRDLLLALLLQVTNAELGGLRERTSPCALLCRIWFFVSMQGGLLR